MKTNQFMTYNDAYSKRRCLLLDPHKTLNIKRAPCRNFECQTWWYVKKQLGFKWLITDSCLLVGVYVSFV